MKLNDLQKRSIQLSVAFGVIIILMSCQTIKLEPFPGDTIGIVLMHGKNGTSTYVRSLASSLEGAGVIVITPRMPWGRNRIYDKSYEESMDEIDTYVDQLINAGAKRIIIAGHSIGANAALGYAARRKNISGVVLLAYGHVPGISGFGYKLSKGTEKAKNMIDQGRGESRSDFQDAGGGDPIVRGTANDIFSWFDPDGPATIKHNAPKVNPNTPVLCVYGRYDPYQRCSTIHRELPVNSNFRVVEADASHLDTPSESIEIVGAWLRSLN